MRSPTWSATRYRACASTRSNSSSPARFARSIAACEAGNPTEIAGLAIRLGHAVVGWVVLKCSASAPGWVDDGAVVIRGLRVDESHPGRGIGSAALAELARWVDPALAGVIAAGAARR